MVGQTLPKVLRLSRFAHEASSLRHLLSIDSTASIYGRRCIGWGISKHRQVLVEEVLASNLLGLDFDSLEITGHVVLASIPALFGVDDAVLLGHTRVSPPLLVFHLRAREIYGDALSVSGCLRARKCR